MKNLILFSLFIYGCAQFNDVASERRQPAFASLNVLAEDRDSIAAQGLKTLDFPRVAANDPVIANTAVGVFSNADTPAVLRFIKLAKSTIDIEIYEMNDSGVRAALREAMTSVNKVKVRIVMEPRPIGDSCPLFDESELNSAKPKSARKRKQKLDRFGRVKAPKAPTAACLDMKKFVEEVRSQNFEGPKFVPFNKEELCGQTKKQGICFQHGKLIVIDRKWALISTGNFNSSNLCNLEDSPRPIKCNRDYSYVTRDPEAVQALSSIIARDLEAKRYSTDLKELLNSGGLPDKITVSPYSELPLSRFIQSASRTLQLQNQYLYADSGLIEPLIAVAKSGVDVEVMLTDLCNFGKVSSTQKANSEQVFSSMEKAGIKIKMFTQRKLINSLPGYLHAKVIVIDGNDANRARAWVGSVNGSKSSVSQNREFGIFFNHRERVQSLSKFLSDDFDDKHNLTWQESLACNKGQPEEVRETQEEVESKDEEEE